MLKKMWKKDGSFVLCEPSQIETMKAAGYELEKMPMAEEVVKEVAEEPVVEEKKTTRRGRKPKAVESKEPDIVL